MSAMLAGQSDAAEEYSHALGSAMEEIGFTVLTGRSIDTNLYHEAEKKILAFFDEKTKHLKAPYRAQRFGSVN